MRRSWGFSPQDQKVLPQKLARRSLGEGLAFHSHGIGRTGRTPWYGLLCTKPTRMSPQHTQQRETY